MAVTGPTICLPQRPQNDWPGCTAVPHASQNIFSSKEKPLRKIRHLQSNTQQKQ
jgi:hypothetical protein